MYMPQRSIFGQFVLGKVVQQRGRWRRVLPNIKPDVLVLIVNDTPLETIGILAECWRLTRVQMV